MYNNRCKKVLIDAQGEMLAAVSGQLFWQQSLSFLEARRVMAGLILGRCL